MEWPGVPTAEHTVNGLDRTPYGTWRFDRQLGNDGRVRRLHAEDGCQITGYTSLAKYADPRGPSYQSIMAALRRHSADATTDGERLLRWAVANTVSGNRDAHAQTIRNPGHYTHLTRPPNRKVETSGRPQPIKKQHIHIDNILQ